MLGGVLEAIKNALLELGPMGMTMAESPGEG